MATIKQVVGTRTAATITLNSLASATYVAATAIDFTTPDPLDVLVELAVTPGTVAGNKQALLFAQVSLDGTNFQTGPTSGTTATDEPNLTLIGVLPLNTNATLQRKVFSVAAAYGGTVPPHVKFVVKNDSGAAFAASGNSLNYSTVLGETV